MVPTKRRRHHERGTWVENEEFWVAGRKIIRKKGEKVPPQMMIKWRELRKSHPELLENMRIWQQPAAFVDGVIYFWMIKEEGERFAQLLRLIDCFMGGWCESSQHACWLAQQIQAAVPPGCTPLAQVTDTGLAAPSKAAGRVKKDELRELMVLKAQQEGTPPSFKAGPREIMQVAKAMHNKMVLMNAESEVVVQEMRMCGWFCFRPKESEGKLVHIDSNPAEERWALRFPESSMRISTSCRRARVNDAHPAGQPALDHERAPVPEELLEVTYCPEEGGEEVGLALDFEQDLLQGAEAERGYALLTHPSQRNAVQKLAAELALMTSQKRAEKRKPKEEKQKETRAEKSARWREALGLQSVESAMSKVKLAVMKSKSKTLKDQKKAAKKASKKKKKMTTFKTAKKALKKVLKDSKKKADAAKFDKAAAKGVSVDSGGGPLQGKLVRLTGQLWGNLLLNAEKRVLLHSVGSKQIRLEGHEICEESQVTEIPEKPKLSLESKCDWRVHMDLAQKESVKTISMEAPAKAGQLADDSALELAWKEILLRGQRAGDELHPARIIFVSPSTQAAKLAHFRIGETVGRDEAWTVMWWELALEDGEEMVFKAARESPREACTILVPVHSQPPLH